MGKRRRPFPESLEDSDSSTEDRGSGAEPENPPLAEEYNDIEGDPSGVGEVRADLLRAQSKELQSMWVRLLLGRWSWVPSQTT